MADEAQRTGGVFLPYPLLGILMTLIVVLGGGIIGMYVKIDTMNATMIMRDSDYRDAQKELKNKAELQELLIRDLREKQIATDRDLSQIMKRRGGG